MASVLEDELPIIAKMFIASSVHRGTDAGMSEKLKTLQSLTREGIFSFSMDELDNFLYQYQLDGYPILSHSDLYRKKYNPSYRVVDAKYISLFPLIRKICCLIHDREQVIVAIDGPCAAGKTTAAALLNSLFGCPVIHMDDFFLPAALRTPQRYSEPGGNIHYERFKTEVIQPLLAKHPVEYGSYDCSTGKITNTNKIEPSRLIIIEGAYSLHPYFENYCDISVYMDILPTIQKQRLLLRNGESGWVRFRDIWIPLEKNYFYTYKIKENSDIIINTQSHLKTV